MHAPRFHIALIQPEIGQNAGNAGRLCLGVGARLHLVHPLGFQTDDKAVRRAGLDYWRDVDVVEHADTDAFFAWAGARPTFLFSALCSRPFTRAPFVEDCVLVFGRESIGLPAALVEARGGYQIPMPGPIRSLNLSNAVAVVAYAALQQIDPQLF